MASAGWGDSRKRAVHDSVGKSDPYDSLESQRLPLDQFPEKWFKFNASFYVTHLLGPPFDWPRTKVGRTNRKLWVHGDNARPHMATVTLQFMQQNAMMRVPHPRYSPDLAHSGFYLFDYIKQLPLRCEFTDRDSLLQRVWDILGGIEKATLEGVFFNWIKILHQFSAMGGEYVE
jgi:hypothetical protein